MIIKNLKSLTYDIFLKKWKHTWGRKINWGIKNLLFNQYERIICVVLNEYITTWKKKCDWRKHKSRI